MHCPYCEEKISIFSKAVNRFGKNRICPHCGKTIVLGVNWVLLAILFVPAVVLALILRPYVEALGLDGFLSTAFSLILLMMFTLKISRGDAA